MKSSNIIVVVALIGWLLVKNDVIDVDLPDLFKSDKEVVTKVEIPEPDASDKELVAPVRKVVKDVDLDKRLAIAHLYMSKADTISRVEGEITSNQVQQWLDAADEYRWRGTNLVGSVPGFSEAANAAVTASIGLEAKTLGPSDREALESVLEAIAWAVKESE